MPTISESDLPKVTPKELSIIKDAAEGLSTKQMAAKYNVNHRAIESYRQRILKKTECANMVQVVAKYLRLGIIA